MSAQVSRRVLWKVKRMKPARIVILLIALAHWLVWEFMTHTEPEPGS